MGAHLSTINSTVHELFKKHDEGSKGYLTLKEIMGIRTLYEVNPCHVGILHQIDRNHDGRFALEELQEFAAFAHGYARAHRNVDAGFMTAGYASLCMWRSLHDEQGRRGVINWAMRCLTEGYELEDLGREGEQYIHRKALKAFHVLFDMERNLGVDYQGLLDMMQCAAEEQQLLDPDNPKHDDWIPLEVLQLFTESLADGMSNIMESIFAEDSEVDEIIRSVQSTTMPGAGNGVAAVSSGGAAFAPTPPVAPKRNCTRGGLVPQLNLQYQRSLQKA